MWGAGGGAGVLYIKRCSWSLPSIMQNCRHARVIFLLLVVLFVLGQSTGSARRHGHSDRHERRPEKHERPLKALLKGPLKGLKGGPGGGRMAEVKTFIASVAGVTKEKAKTMWRQMKKLLRREKHSDRKSGGRHRDKHRKSPEKVLQALKTVLQNNSLPTDIPGDVQELIKQQVGKDSSHRSIRHFFRKLERFLRKITKDEASAFLEKLESISLKNSEIPSPEQLIDMLRAQLSHQPKLLAKLDKLEKKWRKKLRHSKREKRFQ